MGHGAMPPNLRDRIYHGSLQKSTSATVAATAVMTGKYRRELTLSAIYMN